jgi:hypothetical protein
MNTRSIFDADMSRPVIPARPKPDEMSLPEDALAEAMRAEAKRNPVMRKIAWPTNTAQRHHIGPHGLPGNMQPDTIQARIWQHLVAHGPKTREELAAALDEQGWRVAEAVQNLCRRRVVKRQKAWNKRGPVEAVEIE